MLTGFALARIGIIGNTVGGLGFLGLTILLLVLALRGRSHGLLLALACLVNAAWCFVVIGALQHQLTASTLIFAEIVRDGVWLAFVAFMLPQSVAKSSRMLLQLPALVLPIVLFGFFALWLGFHIWPGFQSGLLVFVAGATLMALWALILVEQLFRNAGMDARWGLKYVCLAVAALFVYDFFMYSYSLLGQHVPPAMWNARGAVNAIVVPLIAVAATRESAWTQDMRLSQRAMFHTGALVGCGGYLLVMAVGGYFVRTLGGSWGEFLWVLFSTVTILVLVILLLSGTFRARFKVFISKHFFNYRYDYREEWLNLTRRLNDSDESPDPYQRAIKAVAHMLESPGGALWLLRENQYVCAANWNIPVNGDAVSPQTPLITFLAEHHWIVDLREYKRDPGHYAGLQLPDWLTNIPQACLVIPLLHERGMLGFVVLSVPRAQYQLTWEDLDLLKTIGRQVGSFVGQQESNQALAQAQQFEAFNRTTTFLMHDLKNIMAKQSLLLKNADKHKSNPAFVDDMILTIDSSVKQMKTLLQQLQAPAGDVDGKRHASARRVVAKVIEQLKPNEPQPELKADDEDVFVTVDPERFARILGHVIRNAQEAAGVNGQVRVRVCADSDNARIEIEDNGAGMDAAFIRNHLFQPFYTTKSSRGMGIGAFQAREFIRGAGGDVQVTSRPGQGTVFTINLPMASEQPHEAAVTGQSEANA